MSWITAQSEMIILNYDNTRVKIDLDAIAHNFDAVREKSGVKVMAVIKADAYGHGAIQVARLLEGRCAFFGVSSWRLWSCVRLVSAPPS